MRTDVDERRAEITEWLESGVPRFEIARRLGCKYDTLLVRINKWGLAHLKNPARKGISRPEYRISALNYIAGASSEKTVKSHIARIKLIEDGVFLAECSVCGISEWCGQPAPLELDHIDGNRYNWDLYNLRILCPNCHAQTDTNSGANSGRYKDYKPT